MKHWNTHHSMRRYRRSMRGRRRLMRRRWRGDVGDRAELPAITARSFWRYADIGDCGVGITPQMCNRVTNHGDVSTFSKPDRRVSCPMLNPVLKFIHFLDYLNFGTLFE